jgi:hypothetical protein
MKDWSISLNSKRVLAWAVQNSRLGLFALGLWLIWTGLAMWSVALATVAIGVICVGLAVVPYLRPRKDAD